VTYDSLVYPIAVGFVPFDSPVKIDGGRATAVPIEQANGVALPPSFQGSAIGYQPGQTMRVRRTPEEAET